jgi:adenylosuccinate lyase
MKRNLELTKGLVFSQRVMLALINKGLSRHKAYELVQRNAMKAWQGRRTFLSLLKSDTGITTTLPIAEIEPLFDYQYYLRYVDDIFRRLGLTESQWKKKAAISKPMSLAPGSL